MFSSNSLQATLLREKYPVLISNLVDPFATSNYAQAVPVIEILTNLQVPVTIQTRGGKGIEDVLKFLPSSVWYISIPMLDDDIRKRYEPAAPSIQSRLELIDNLKSLGHDVIVGINPTSPTFLPNNDAYLLIDILRNKGVHGIWMAPLHFNTKQLAVMPLRDKSMLGNDLIQEGVKSSRIIQPHVEQFMLNICKYALDKGLAVEGINHVGGNNFFDAFYNKYDKCFPNIYQFLNWCIQNKANNEPVYYQEFEDLLLPLLPKGDFNISPYMRCMNRDVDNEIRSEEGYKQSFKRLLQLSWNDRRMKRSLHESLFQYAVGIELHEDSANFSLDAQGNLIQYFNNDMFSENYFLTNTI
ncbi:radical SAM family protein [Chitinophaga skermanii]|nr:hypothetical protein [Chitinophaga skermanii]